MTNIGLVSKHVLKGQCKEIFQFLLETEDRFPSAIMHNLKTNTVSGFSSDRSGLYTKAIDAQYLVCKVEKLQYLSRNSIDNLH
jgi:hypothetical protein